MQSLDRGQGDTVGINGGDVLFVLADGEGRVKILGDGSDVAGGSILGFVIPLEDGQCRDLLQNLAGVDRREVGLAGAVT